MVFETRKPDPAERDEFAKLGDAAARAAGKPTRKFKREDTTIPRESKVALLIAAGIVLLLAVVPIVRLIVGTDEKPAPKTTVPAIQQRHMPPKEPELPASKPVEEKED